MLVRDLLQTKNNSQIYSIGPEETVAVALENMLAAEVGSLVVMAEDAMLGLLTERDVVRGLARLGGAVPGARVREVMNPEPFVAALEDTVDYLRGVMTERRITHLVVRDAATAAVLGVVSFHDIARGSLNACNFENALMKRYIKNWPE